MLPSPTGTASSGNSARAAWPPSISLKVCGIADRSPSKYSARTSPQLEFVNHIVDHLTEHGVVEAVRLYESPFTDLTPHGPDALFKATEVDELLGTLLAVRATAVAAWTRRSTHALASRIASGPTSPPSIVVQTIRTLVQAY
jgi:hypothetical protein